MNTVTHIHANSSRHVRRPAATIETSHTREQREDGSRYETLTIHLRLKGDTQAFTFFLDSAQVLVTALQTALASPGETIRLKQSAKPPAQKE